MRLHTVLVGTFFGLTVLADGVSVGAQSTVVPINRRGNPNAHVTEVTELRPEIKTADPRQYTAVRDAHDWLNPFLTVGPEDVEVRARGVPSRTIPVTAVAGVLASLPFGAWPYGRVVGVTVPGVVRNPDPGREAIDANIKAVRDALKALSVEADRWPR